MPTGWQKMAFLKGEITFVFSLWASLLYVALMSLPLGAEAPKRSQYIWKTGQLPIFPTLPFFFLGDRMKLICVAPSWIVSVFLPRLIVSVIIHSLSCCNSTNLYDFLSSVEHKRVPFVPKKGKPFVRPKQSYHNLGI